MRDLFKHLRISDKHKTHPPQDSDDLFHRYSIDTGKKYGEGGYGATYPAMDNTTKEQLAVKVIDTRRMKLASIVRECEFLLSLDHPNVIKIKAHGLGRKSAAQARARTVPAALVLLVLSAARLHYTSGRILIQMHATPDTTPCAQACQC